MGAAAVQTFVTESSTVAAERGHSTGCAGDMIHNSRLVNVRLLAGARDGEVEMVREAIRGGAYLETRQPMRMLAGDISVSEMSTMVSGPTPLMLASKSGSSGCVKALLEAKAKILAVDEDNMQPVHFAALSGELEILDLLVGAGADPRVRDNEGKGVIDHLCRDVTTDAFMFRKWKEVVARGPRVKSDIVKETSDGHDFDLPAEHEDIAPGILVPKLRADL